MARLGKEDAAHVRRLRDLLERYRPSERPIAETFIRELEPVVAGEGTLAMRPVHGELGWSLDFLYCTRDPAPVRELMTRFGAAWSPFFPTTPAPLRNRALRPKVVHRELVLAPPSPEYAKALAYIAKMPGYGLRTDDLGVSVCDGDVVLAWFGCTRREPFGARELAVVDALVPSLRARMLLEHQLGHAVATQALLEAALEAIPAAAFVLRGASIGHANATGRLLLERDRSGAVRRLRESLRVRSASSPFSITPVESPGASALSLAVLRPDGTDDVRARLLAFAARHGLTPRQADVLALLARGYGNKTIAERIGVVEGTVEEHVTLLLDKTGTDSRAALVAKFWTS